MEATGKLETTPVLAVELPEPVMDPGAVPIVIDGTFDDLEQLRHTGVIDETQQDKIDATLARTVPHPTQEEWNVYNAGLARIRKEQTDITEERERIQELWSAFNKGS